MSPRIAAVHVPCFGLQALRRSRPELRHAPLALHDPSRNRGRILEACRRARAADVVEGMTLAQARASCHDLQVLAPDAGAEAQARMAIHEGLLLVSPVVEWAGGGTSYLDAHGLSRVHGSELALLARAVQALDEAGFTARAACSSSRLVSSLAARSRPGPCVVAPGGDAAFLAPLPVTLLPLGEEPLRRLGLLGVTSLGQFARLPADGLADRFGREAARWQRLVRGEDPAPLLPFRPSSGPRVVRELESPVGGLEAVTFLLKTCCEELCDALEARGMFVARLELALALDDPPGGADVRLLEPARPMGSARALLALCRLEIEERRLAAPLMGLGLSVIEELPARGIAGELFGESFDEEAFAAAVDRVRALVGSRDVVTPARRPAHRREARVDWQPFRMPGTRKARGAPTAEPATDDGGDADDVIAERLIAPPVPVLVRLPGPGGAGSLHASPTARAELGLPERLDVVEARGPLRLMGEWWDGGADVDRDEWLLVGADGGAYRAIRDRRTREWALLGVID